MLYINQQQSSTKKIAVFGTGQVYQQMLPHLTSEGITISNLFDDTSLNQQGKSIKNENDLDINLFFCVGYKDMKARFERYKALKEIGYKMVGYVCNNAIISDESVLEEGSIVNQGVIIDNFVQIGECVFINIGTTISHHSIIRNNVFIAPSVSIAGFVTVEEGAFIGINSTIIDHITIGEYSVVAAGAVVTKDVPPYTMVAGNPATVKKKL